MATLKEILKNKKVVDLIKDLQSKAFQEVGGYEDGTIAELEAYVSVLEAFIDKMPQNVEEGAHIIEEMIEEY